MVILAFTEWKEGFFANFNVLEGKRTKAKDVILFSVSFGILVSNNHQLTISFVSFKGLLLLAFKGPTTKAITDHQWEYVGNDSLEK